MIRWVVHYAIMTVSLIVLFSLFLVGLVMFVSHHFIYGLMAWAVFGLLLRATRDVLDGEDDAW